MVVQLTEMQLDVLKEVINVGAGNAATALSQLVNRRVDMGVPHIQIMSFTDMVNTLGADEDITVAVELKVFGDAPGNILYTMNYDKAYKFANTLLEKYPDKTDEVYLSLFHETGNILGNAFLNAISKFTNLNLITSVPAVAIDMLVAIISSSFIEAEQYDDYVLSIDTSFMDTSDIDDPGGSFIFIPKPGSLKIILGNLGF